MADEQIIARRVTLDEFCDYIGGLDYIYGRILTKSGIELFVGVEEFAESARLSLATAFEYSLSLIFQTPD